MLELQQIVKHYSGAGGEPVRAVDGVSLTVEAGEFVALYGPSGSGKTTLLLLAAGMVAPDRGSVRFAGRDIASLSRDEAADYRLRSLGFVFQAFRLEPDLTAVDNAMLKLVGAGLRRREAQRQVTPLLEQVGLGDRLDHLARRLSRGEQQRVAIVRALANDPALILADEPTGNLDSRRGAEILALLRETCRTRQVGLILVTHDEQATAYADRVLVLRDGELHDAEPGVARVRAR